MSARLAISTEEGLLLDTVLSSTPLRIGRAKDNSLRSEDRRTSRYHTIVRQLASGDYEAEDLGSSYGTLLNGRPIKKETLKHQDILRCGALSIQFLRDSISETDPAAHAPPAIMTATLDNLFEARSQIRQLIDEQAMLRAEVGAAQEAEDRAKKLREQAQDEVERLHKVITQLRTESAVQKERIGELGRELRERLSAKSEVPPAVEALRKELAETLRQVERHKNRAVELEEREAARVNREQALRKETERLAEQLKQREQRELQVTQAIKPALARIAELTQELEMLRIKLAHTEAKLSELKLR